MSLNSSIALDLARLFLDGDWSAATLTRQAVRLWGGRARWQRGLAEAVLAAFPGETRPDEARLAGFIWNDAGFRRAWQYARKQAGLPTELRLIFGVPERMTPCSGTPASWDIPSLNSPGNLAEWLDATPAELDWFADCQQRLRRAATGPCSHYTYRWLTTGRRPRLLEVPKARLKMIQRRLLHELLDRIPPHEAVHGYRRGRSLLTYVAPHAGRRVILHLDLCQFFPSVTASRVHALFRTGGYPRAVARLLTGLCTNTVPGEVLRGRPEGTSPSRVLEDDRLLRPHLPQGAPTSPALANLCAYRLDCRLTGLARAAGASYTRYADDLVFSGGTDFEGALRRFHVHVCRTALEEGFEVNTRKSHFLRQGVRQQVAGIVLNEHPNLPRAEYDRLRAILTNCVRHGPAEQNREGHADFRAHLAGRVGYFVQVNPRRGQRLRELFERIAW